MQGLPYKDTFAAKGSNLHTALVEGDAKKAKAIYEDTYARYNASIQPKEATCSSKQQTKKP